MDVKHCCPCEAVAVSVAERRCVFLVILNGNKTDFGGHSDCKSEFGSEIGSRRGVNDDYILDTKTPNLTVLEYFKKFKNELPHLVMVTGGGYSFTDYDDYSMDQVIRFYTYSSQPRVLARDAREAKSVNPKFLNIPVDCTNRFQVVNGPNKLSPPRRMADILEKCKRENNQIVPFLVRFADTSPEIVCGNGKETQEMTSELLIFKEYHEHYLLGNCMVNGKSTKQTTTAALSDDIQLTKIIGIQGKSEEEFSKYLAEIDEFVSKNCTFDKQTGNPAITKFDCLSNSTGTGAAIDPENPLVDIKDAMPTQETKAAKVNHVVHLEEAMPNLEDKAPKLPSRIGQSRKTVEDNVEVIYAISENQTEGDDDDDSDSSGNLYRSERAKETSYYLDSITISGVREILKKLKLEKYVDAFEEDMIDGMLLRSITEDMLKQDYKFKSAEAVRLIQYIQHGHIPE